MNATARITPEMVPQMSTLELRFAIKQLSGVETATRNTTAMRARVLKLIAAIAPAPSAPAAEPPPVSRITNELPPATPAPKRAKAKPAPKAKAEAPKAKPERFEHDHRVLALYKIGDHIDKRDAKGVLLARVEVVKDGFSWRGETYDSLTPIATEVSGTAQSGLVYFGVIPYNDRDRKGKTTADIAPAFDAALGVFNLVAKGLGLETLELGGLASLESHEDHEAVRQGVARLRSYARQMKAQLAALALGENLLEVRHGRAPEVA